MAQTLGIALLGCGTVGSGVAEALLGQRERLARRCNGTRLELRHVVVRDPSRGGIGIPPESIHDDFQRVLNDPAVDVVIELIGGTTSAKVMILSALAAGKHIITANKALLAEHGPAIFDAARRAGRTVGFEAAVAGGIPIIKMLVESLAVNQVTAIQGILNGTSNYILSRMAERGTSYDAALSEAQAQGFAEANPTLDVDGTDAVHKLAILAQVAFGVTPSLSQITSRGIADVSPLDIRFASELGYTIKLLAEARLVHNTLALFVSPVLLRRTDPLAQVQGPFNAIRVQGDLVGEVLLRGPGAGKSPTTSSVLSDLVDLAVGRAERTFSAANLWSGDAPGAPVLTSDWIPKRYYLRMLVRDEPGVLAEIGLCLARESISIASVVQHETMEGHPEQTLPVVIMTHTAGAGQFRHAVTAIDQLPTLNGPAVFYPVSD